MHACRGIHTHADRVHTRWTLGYRQQLDSSVPGRHMDVAEVHTIASHRSALLEQYYACAAGVKVLQWECVSCRAGNLAASLLIGVVMLLKQQVQ